MSAPYVNRLGFFFGSLLLFGCILLASYGVLRWMGIDPGHISTWFAGLLIFWWLVVVVVLPWDFYFQAKTLLNDSLRSQEQGFPVKPADLNYVKLWSNWSLVLAIGLHLLTAVVLVLLQIFGLTTLGYLAAAAAILLMGLRPAGRGYDYLVQRLTNIGNEIRYPQDNVAELLIKLGKLEEQVSELRDTLNLENPESWAACTQNQVEKSAHEQELQRTQLEDFRRLNEEAHRQLARDAKAAAAQVAEDGQVLNHVRELVRFFKEA